VTQLENVEEPPKAPGIVVPEHQSRRALMYPLKVIVSPFKAFKEIAQNPSFIGLILIFSLFMLLSGGQEYVRASKIMLDSGAQSVSLLYYNSFASRFGVVLVRSFYGLFLNWITYAGILFLLLRVFNEKLVPLRPFLIVVGYTFSILILYVAVSSVLVSTLPQVAIPLDKWISQTPEDVQLVAKIVNDTWGPTIASSLINVLSLAFNFWLMLLGAVALHLSVETKWAKALLLSIVAYLASIILTGLLSTIF
jgi:hypothetical protein